MEQLSANLISMNLNIKEEIQSALTTITASLSTLATQVNELNDKDKQREKQISTMDTRIIKIDQQIINKNIEIRNIPTNEMSDYDVIKTIAASLNVELNHNDICNAYHLKQQQEGKIKVIIELNSLNKKREIMSKIQRHRLDAKIIKKDDDGFIYVNDELTPYNRRLLWQAKTKAKESKWNFVWCRNGNIFARRNENSSAILIKNTADIENINQKN